MVLDQITSFLNINFFFPKNVTHKILDDNLPVQSTIESA